MKFEEYQKEVYKHRFDKDRMKEFIKNLIVLREFDEKDEVIKEEYLEKEEFMDKMEALFLFFKDKDFAKNKKVTVSLLKLGEDFDRYFDNNCLEHLLKDYKDMWIFGLNQTHTDVVTTDKEVKFYKKSPKQFENCRHISEIFDFIIKGISKLKEDGVYSYMNLDIYNDEELKNGNINSYIFYSEKNVHFNEKNLKVLLIKTMAYLIEKGIKNIDEKYIDFLKEIENKAKNNKLDSVIDIDNIVISDDFKIQDLDFITIKKDSDIKKIKLLSSTNGANMFSIFNSENEEWLRDCNKINLGLALGLKNFLENYYKVYDEEKSE